MSGERDRIDLLLAQEPAGSRDIGPYLHAGITRRSGPMIAVRVLLSAAAFLSAYQLLRVSAQNITLSDAALLMAFVLLVTQGAVSAMPFGLFTPLWFGAVGTMLGGLFLSSLLNGDLLRWMIIALQYMVAYLLLPMVVMSQPRNFIKRMAALFVVGVAVLEASGILASFVMSANDASSLFGIGFLAGNGRMGSFVGEANWNGAMIAFAVSILMYVIHERLLPLPVGIACGIALLWGLLMSASFTGFAANYPMDLRGAASVAARGLSEQSDGTPPLPHAARSARRAPTRGRRARHPSRGRNPSPSRSTPDTARGPASGPSSRVRTH